MRRDHNPGTPVRELLNGIEGTIADNRKTRPDLDHRFDYVMVWQDNDGTLYSWGYAASELEVIEHT
jgi:hypothetical protein